MFPPPRKMGAIFWYLKPDLRWYFIGVIKKQMHWLVITMCSKKKIICFTKFSNLVKLDLLEVFLCQCQMLNKNLGKIHFCLLFIYFIYLSLEEMDHVFQNLSWYLGLNNMNFVQFIHTQQLYFQKYLYTGTKGLRP